MDTAIIKVVLILAALGFSHTVCAFPLNDHDVKTCQAQARTAEIVMDQRQEIDDMDASLAAAATLEDEPGISPENQYRNFFYAAITDAYRRPRYMTPMARKEATEQFKTLVLQLCLDSRLKAEAR